MGGLEALRWGDGDAAERLLDPDGVFEAFDRAEPAAADIRAVSGNPAVDAFAADMSSQAEVRRLAGAVLYAYPRLDVRVNNVGGFWAHRHPTVETPIYLASSPDVDGVIGRFYANGKPKTPNKIAGDAAMTARLSQVSADLVAGRRTLPRHHGPHAPTYLT